MPAGIKPLICNGRPDRIVRLLGPIDPASVVPVMDGLLSTAHTGDDPIVLQISSPGGCVSSGLSIVDTMDHVLAPVFTIATGMVASMAAIILASGEAGYRYALAHTRIMLHPISGRTAGRLEEIESAMRLHRELDHEVENLLLERTRIPKRRLRSLLRQERFLSAVEAVDLGIIDHLI